MRISDWSSDVCSSDLGTGQTIAAFISYAVEKRVAADPSRFGKGAIEGIAAPEAANNASAQTAFIPTLSLGIPGSATMALMLGAMMIHGIAPGPMVIVNHPDIVWGVVASFFIGNVLLVGLTVTSEEPTSELQSIMRISYAVFCLKKKKQNKRPQTL